MNDNQYSYGEQWVPEDYWKCSKCGALVLYGRTHDCPVSGYGYGQIYTSNDRDLLIQIIGQLQQIVMLLKELKETKSNE